MKKPYRYYKTRLRNAVTTEAGRTYCCGLQVEIPISLNNTPGSIAKDAQEYGVISVRFPCGYWQWVDTQDIDIRPLESMETNDNRPTFAR